MFVQPFFSIMYTMINLVTEIAIILWKIWHFRKQRVLKLSQGEAD